MIYETDIESKSSIVVIDGFIAKHQGKIVRFPLLKIGEYDCIVNDELSKPIFISSGEDKVVICNKEFMNYLIEQSQEMI